VADHRTELRRELLAAAHRLDNADKVRPRQPLRRVGVLAAAFALLVVATALVVTRGPDPAAADVFSITVQDHDLVIEIVGAVDDAKAATAELDAEGIHAKLVPVPAAPSLVGEVVSAFSDFGEMDNKNVGGRTTEIRIPVDAVGTLTIRYGREAKPDETYEATESVPDCRSAYAGRIVTDGIRRQLADAYGPEIRWQEFADGTPSNIDGDAVRPRAEIIDVLPIDPRTVLILVTDGASNPPSGLTCSG